MPAPTDEAIRAAAAARRFDDAFRSCLAERGAKPVPLAEVTSLVTGVVGLRLAGDAVLDLWQHDDAADGDRHDLCGEDGQATATAVRMIWTGDHLDAARRLQDTLAGPAQTAVLQRALTPAAINGWLFIGTAVGRLPARSAVATA